jgi:hypothetical protein
MRLTRRGVAPIGLSFDRVGTSIDASFNPIPVLVGTHLVDTTLRGALMVGLGRDALVGIVTSEAIALSERIIKSMTNARLMLMAASVLVAGLLTPGAGVMAYSVTQQENAAPQRSPGQTDHQPAPAAEFAQDPPRPAAPKPAMDQGPLTIQVQVVDPRGGHLSGADIAVVFVYSRGSGTLEMVTELSKSNAEGRARLEVAREHPGAMLSHAVVWAYQPGHAIATTSVGPRPVLLAKIASPLVIPLTLDQSAKWTITVLGPEDRPIAGLRLAPTLLSHTVGRTPHLSTVPDALLEALAVTTDAKGVATLTCLTETMKPLAIQLAGPGVAPHTLRLDAPKGTNIDFRLARQGRVVGVVRTASGPPLAGVPVEVWVRGWGTFRAALRVPHRETPDALLRFDQVPVKTGPQGAFQTPPTLLNGSTYRVSIRQDGFVPFVSDWVTLDGERATISPIRLQPLQKLSGQIKDRQSRAVAGARVFLTAGGPSAATDAEGRFTLASIIPGKTVVLAEKAGFRLQGWLVDSSSQAEVGSLTLVRASEALGEIMKPLADPITPNESRALADRLLEPYLHEAPEKENDRARLAAILALSEFDVDRALDLFQNSNFRDEDFYNQNIRGSLAARLAGKDPARAEAMIEAIPDLLARATALPIVAKALPASERRRKQVLLDRATTLLRDHLQRANPGSRLLLIAEIAEQWLDMSERDRARVVIQEGKTIFGPLNDAGRSYHTMFPGQLARLEPGQVMEWLQKLPSYVSRDAEVALVAAQLATDHPADAERIYNLREGVGDQHYSHTDTMRLCRRLARVDPARARRVAASLGIPGARACAWAFVALGMAEKGNADAALALDHAIREIDELRESGPGPEQVWIVSGVRLMYPTNPAAVILPVVERVAPDRLAEVFWRAVALHPGLEIDRDYLLQTSCIGFECILLSRYDRAVAAALFEPMDSYLNSIARRKGPHIEFASSHIVAKACLDPVAAVAFLESLTPPQDFSPATPAIEARFTLAEVLGLPPEKRWLRLWHSMGAWIPLDD